MFNILTSCFGLPYLLLCWSDRGETTSIGQATNETTCETTSWCNQGSDFCACTMVVMTKRYFNLPLKNDAKYFIILDTLLMNTSPVRF